MLSYLSFEAGNRNRNLGDWPMERGERLCCTFDGNIFMMLRAVLLLLVLWVPFESMGTALLVDVQPIEKVEEDLLQI
jgi:hypothetical protein